MIITNNYNLPEPLVSAVKAFQYNYKKSLDGEEKFSVTELLKPAYMLKLQKKYHNDVEEDVTERFWALEGQAMHAILSAQYSDNSLSEERLTISINNVKISGQIDFYKDGILDDYKNTTVWKFIFKDFIEYERQLNIYRLLLIHAGFPVNQLRIIMLLKDWSKSKAKYDPSYPDIPIKTINIPIWDIKDTYNYVKERIEYHLNEYPDICLPEDRWETPTTYAIIKNENKRSLKNYTDELLAKDHIERLKKTDSKNKYAIEIRPGESRRCEYCNVKKYCDLWMEAIK